MEKNMLKKMYCEPGRHSEIAWIPFFKKWKCKHVKHLCHVHPSDDHEYHPNQSCVEAPQQMLALLPTQPSISLLKTSSSLLSSNSYSFLIFWGPLSRVTRFVVKALPLSGWALGTFRCLSQERKNEQLWGKRWPDVSCFCVVPAGKSSGMKGFYRENS